MTKRLFLLAAGLGALAAAAGCTSDATCSASVLGLSGCERGYYCAQVEYCTKRCGNDSDCQIGCSPDESCAGLGKCEGGACASTKDYRCTDGYCQRTCVLDGGGTAPCDYDPYGPTSRHAERK